MEYVHRPYQKGETIAAIATPPGEGAIAIVRISGDDAISIAGKIFSKDVQKIKSHTAHYGEIRSEEGEVIDHALLLLMRNPKSFTGEDTVEIHCHGGRLIPKRVLQRVLQAGARAANPGEFTFKAFMNAKLDLTQAEAVQELICAKNEQAVSAASKHLQGSLHKKIHTFQKNLTEIAAILEAWIDFPEEGLEFATVEEVCATLQNTNEKMKQLHSTFEQGKILHDGLVLCLIGTPNVGKSSLMNALLGKERAIVTEVAGTTRDVLEEDLYLNGLHFRLLDTAGIRNTDELIEQEGIRRAKVAMNSADLILLVLDASRELSDEEKVLLQNAPLEKTIVIWNKIDLGSPPEIVNAPFVVCTSAKEHRGMNALHNEIDRCIWKKGPPSKEEVIITQIRHKQSLENAIQSCEKVLCGLKENLSAEFVSSDMRSVLMELGTIIGTNVSEDVLSAIFSKFCVGK